MNWATIVRETPFDVPVKRIRKLPVARSMKVPTGFAVEQADWLFAGSGW